MGRPSNTDARRAEIVQAMAQVVARNGYEGASIGEIGRAAGLTAGLVHYHFESKQEVFLELIATHARTHAELLERRLTEAGEDPRERLTAFIDTHLALGPDASPVAVACWVAIAAEAVRERVVRTAYQQAIDADLKALESIIRSCLKSSSDSGRGAKAIAAGIFAAIQGCFVLSTAAPKAIPAGTAARTVRRMAVGLIEDRGPDRRTT